MIRSFRLPFAASIAGHCGVVVLLLLFAGYLPPVPLPIARGIEVMLTLPEPVTEPPPILQAEPPPPEPPPPVVEAEPPPPEPEPPPPRPRPKPVVKRPALQPVREPIPDRAMTPVVPPPPAPVQTAAIPRPAPAGPIVSAGYRTALSTWLESHKHYPESARARGEEGRAVLRFHVDRSGRVLNYALVQSTGYPDLDAAIGQMMRGASLPPFPADMAASDVEVSVGIRYAIAR